MCEKLRLARPFLLLALTLFCGLVCAADVVYYINGVRYAFPATQGDADRILTNDGSGNLSWSVAPSAEGIVPGMIVLSTVACPAGWTRVSAADDRAFRGSAAYGGTGGLDTHSHSVSGVLSAQSLSMTGSVGSAAVSITGSTGVMSIAHTHDITSTRRGAAGSFDEQPLERIAVNSSNPSHSHDVGSLAGDAHTHGTGSLSGASHGHSYGSYALVSESNLPAYITIIACRKD
jgi:hypothetical protein